MTNQAGYYASAPSKGVNVMWHVYSKMQKYILRLVSYFQSSIIVINIRYKALLRRDLQHYFTKDRDQVAPKGSVTNPNVSQ